jgi:hypothetical protein
MHSFAKSFIGRLKNRQDDDENGVFGQTLSMRKRKQIEECFGWMKNIGLMRKLRHRGKKLVNQLFLFTAAAYNLVRMRRLLA